jgi:hypothetical protein
MYPPLWTSIEDLDRATTSCLSRVFLRMFVALLVTAAAAMAVVSSEALMALIFGNSYAMIGLIIVQVVLVIAISAGINRMSSAAANVLFFTYAIMNGLTLSVIFLVYELGIIYHAFAVSALMFAGMALYGTITRRDLSSIGSLCIMGLFGIIIASIANMLFFRSASIETAVLYIGVLVFVGLTAYDTQRIKRMLRDANAFSHDEAIKKISVIGALTLYLDFINLFLKILRILGRRR